MLHFLKKEPPQMIRFVCHPEDNGVIAPPVRAKSVLPDWFRRLPPVDKRHLSTTNNGLTVKRCMPFLDAMSAGWILPIAATVRLDIKDGGRCVEAGWEFDRVMVSNHGAHQVAGNPKEPSPPCKFHNYWSIRTPPGWSCLFLPPLNRPGQAFECASGGRRYGHLYRSHPFSVLRHGTRWSLRHREGNAAGAGDPFPSCRCGSHGRNPRRDPCGGCRARGDPPEHHGRRGLVSQDGARGPLNDPPLIKAGTEASVPASFFPFNSFAASAPRVP